MNGVWNTEVHAFYLAHLGKAGNQLPSEHLSEVEVTTRDYCCAR